MQQPLLHSCMELQDMPLLNNPDFDSHVDFDAEFEHVPSSLKQQPVSQKDDSEHSSLDDLNRLSQFSDDV